MEQVIKPLGGHSVFLLLIQLALLLLVARVGAELARRMGLPAVVGELAAGIGLGPSGIGHWFPHAFRTVFPSDTAQFHLLDVVGVLGMTLLLLLTGLETDIRLLRNLGRAALIASVMGMVVPFATGFGLGMLTPEHYLAQPDRRVLFSFFLATSMAISAMPVIAKILMDLDLTRRNIGLIILSAGVVDDTAGWLVLSVIAGVASQGHVQVGSILMTLAFTVAFVVVMAVVVFPLCRAFMANARRRFLTQDTDLVFLLVMTFLCAAITEAIGIHAVFGAFVAGVLFKQVPALGSDVVHRLESFVFAVLAPVFFGIVGLKVDLWQLGSGGGGMLVIVVAIACLGKLIGCTVGSVWGGLRFWEGLSIAVAMNARGAMELVVATIGLSLGILNQQMFSIIVVVAITTSFMAPLGLRLTMRKVRLTEDEQRRILAERAKGLFDPERVRVLLPTSGGSNEAAACMLAAGLAKLSAHKVDVLSILEPESWSERLLRWFTPRSARPVSDTQAAISRHLEDAGLPVAVRTQTSSDVAGAILEQARKGIDFIVMGASSDRSGWLGDGVLADVVRGAPCHLAIVHAGRHDANPRHKTMLVQYDGGVLARVAVEFAVRYAEAIAAELTIAVLTEPRRATIGHGGPDLVATAAPAGNGTEDERALLESISPVLRATSLAPKTVHFVQSPLANPFTAEAASGKYDLVVVGSENRAIQHRLFFGRDSEELLRRTPSTLAFIVPSVAMLR